MIYETFCGNIELLILEVSIQPGRLTAPNRLNTNLVNPLKGVPYEL